MREGWVWNTEKNNNGSSFQAQAVQDDTDA